MTDLKIRQKCEEMIAYGYVALRQFPKSERHVLAQELRSTMWCMLRERRYVRYMDDFCVVHHDKGHLHAVRTMVEGFLCERLGLSLNHKTAIFPVATRRGRSLDFLGYRIYQTHMALRKSSGLRMQRGLKKLAELYRAGKCDVSRVRASIQSWLGHCSHCRSYAVRRRVLGSVVLTVGKEAQA